jgi:hypothetical protein
MDQQSCIAQQSQTFIGTRGGGNWVKVFGEKTFLGDIVEQ